MRKFLKDNRSGFTLIEILVVIGIIAVLAGVVLVAINPARQFAQARNTQRTSNVEAILNAIGQYIADNKGDLPTGVATTAMAIEDASTNGQAFCEALVPKYLSALPVAPEEGDAAIDDCTVANWVTGYTVVQASSTGRITVSADAPELGETIEITR